MDAMDFEMEYPQESIGSGGPVHCPHIPALNNTHGFSQPFTSTYSSYGYPSTSTPWPPPSISGSQPYGTYHGYGTPSMTPTSANTPHVTTADTAPPNLARHLGPSFGASSTDWMINRPQNFSVSSSTPRQAFDPHHPSIQYPHANPHPDSWARLGGPPPLYPGNPQNRYDPHARNTNTNMNRFVGQASANQPTDGSNPPSRIWPTTSNPHLRPALRHATTQASLPLPESSTSMAPATSLPPAASQTPSTSSYAPDSYAGLMSSNPGNRHSFEVNAAQLYNALERVPGGPSSGGSSSRATRERRYQEYLSSGEMERNMALSYSQNTLTRPGQPLLDFQGHLAAISRANEENTPPNETPRASDRPRTLRRHRALVPERDSSDTHLGHPHHYHARVSSADTSRFRRGPSTLGNSLTTMDREREERLIPGRAERQMLMTHEALGIPKRRATKRFLKKGMVEIKVDALPEDERNCAICMETLSEPEPIEGKVEHPVRLPCGHVFGRNCIQIWFSDNYTCPSCRRAVESEMSYSAETIRRIEESHQDMAFAQHVIEHVHRYGLASGPNPSSIDGIQGVTATLASRPLTEQPGLTGANATATRSRGSRHARQEAADLGLYANLQAEMDRAAAYRSLRAEHMPLLAGEPLRHARQGRQHRSIPDDADISRLVGPLRPAVLESMWSRRPVESSDATPRTQTTRPSNSPPSALGQLGGDHRSPHVRFSEQRPEIEDFARSSSRISSRLSTMFRGDPPSDVDALATAGTSAPPAPASAAAIAIPAPRTRTNDAVQPAAPPMATFLTQPPPIRTRRHRTRDSQSTIGSTDAEEEASSALRIDG